MYGRKITLFLAILMGGVSIFIAALIILFHFKICFILKYKIDFHEAYIFLSFVLDYVV